MCGRSICVVATFLIAGMYPVLSSMGFANTSFSDTDFTIVGIVFGNLTKILSGNMLMVLVIILFIIPIIYNVLTGQKSKENYVFLWFRFRYIFCYGDECEKSIKESWD